MKLILYDTDNIISDDFKSFMRKIIAIEIRRAIKPAKIQPIINFYIEKGVIAPTVTIKQVILEAIAHYKVETKGDKVIFSISSTYKPKWSKVPLLAICKAINYGNLQIRGAYTFTNALEAVVDKLDSHVNMFQLIGDPLQLAENRRFK